MIARELIKKSDVFAGLTEAELDKVAGSALEKRFESGTTIFKEGDTAEEILILQEGRVAIQIMLPKVEGQTSRRVTVDVATRNDVLDWSAVVEPFHYSCTAMCLQEARAISISGNKLRWLVQENPKVGYELLRGLIRVMACRLDDTRKVLVSERLVTQSA